MGQCKGCNAKNKQDGYGQEEEEDWHPFEKEETLVSRLDKQITDRSLNKGRASGGQSGWAHPFETTPWACAENIHPPCETDSSFR